MLITFKDEETKNKFVSCVTVRFRGSSSLIDDEDMPLTFLNIYDAPHELSDEALVERLDKYCTVFSRRRGKFPKSHAFNGMRHYRVRRKGPIPSYLRFGKFLVRLSYDGQQHTCRRCNRVGHFANECDNTVCFNCEELGHESRNCPHDVRCCICKSTEHLARRCPFSWYKPSSSARVSEPEAGHHHDNGNVATSADGPPLSSVGEDVSRDVSPPEVSDSDILAAAAEVQSPGDVSSAREFLDSQGFLQGLVGLSRELEKFPNPPGPQSTPVSQDTPASQGTTDEDAMDPDLSDDLLPDPPADPPVPLVDLTADSPAVPPADPPAAPPADPPDGPSSVPSEVSSASSVKNPVPGRSSVASSRRKPAPLPPALEALSRRPTRPTLAVSGKSAASPRSSSVGAESEMEEMVTQSSLKRKKEVVTRKKEPPKKGKH